MEENKNILKQWVISAINNRSSKELKEIFETIPNIDIAEAIADVEDPKQLLYMEANTLLNSLRNFLQNNKKSSLTLSLIKN